MLKVEGVCKSYKKGGWFSKAQQQVLYDISFEWKQGECLGVIGESGSGKSTLGRLLLGIEKPDRGEITYNGKSVSNRRSSRGGFSAVFQDYTSSINPFYTVEQSMLEPLKLAKEEPKLRESKMEGLLVQVGLDASYLPKYPHELSGGEAQRVCIARALSTEPACIVLDEAISSLDGSVQMQVLELLKSLRASHGMGYIFITHDIQAAAYLCDRVMIVKSGRIEEIALVERLSDVQSPYARELLRKIMV
ncbi:ABC transporter ATP-binding protein [Brevibacillus sp. B_LB10_24]|uniref:ABC transporter ATP-binding protein n=1 Tax=Brevibacillus sp. B_LB10_24 TaxID=3380645 RepID=UPI0038B936D5